MFRLNGVQVPQPDTVTWKSPEVIGFTMTGEPVLGPAFELQLSYSLPTFPEVLDFFIAHLGESVTIEGPGPTGCDGEFCGYISEVSIRKSGSAMDGVDITISNVVPAVSV